MRDLSAKQRTFAEGIARGMSQHDAAKLAGSSKPYLMGSKWMRMDKVRAYLETLKTEATRAAAKSRTTAVRDLTRARVLLWEMAEGERPAEFLTGPDDTVKLKRFKPHAALATLVELDRPQDRGGTVNVQVVNQLPESAVTQVYRALLAGANGNGHHPPEEAP